MIDTPEPGNGPSGQPVMNSRTGAIVTAAVLTLVLVMGAYLGYGFLAARQRAATRLAEGETLIEQADKAVSQVDQAVAAKVTAGVETRAEEALAIVESTSSKLAEAIQILDAVHEELRGADRERDRLLKEAAAARIDMLENAPAILASSAKAGRALPEAESAWERVVEADGLSDRAVASYNKLTRSSVSEASKLNKRAAAQLATARERFMAAEEAFPESGLEVYIAYVDARIELNKLSRRSDAAWLAGDLERANDLIETYNTQDEKAAAQAESLPASPAKVVADAHAGATKAASDRYYAARKRAAAVDVQLQGL